MTLNANSLKMKKIYLICFVFFTVFLTAPVFAQISIDEVNAQEKAAFRDPVKSTAIELEYFSEAKYRAERAAIRKKRNFLEFSAGMQGTLTSYNDAWIATSGGDNSIALIASLHLLHNFKKDLFEIETRFDAKFGYNRMKVENVETGSTGVWFKNQDEFALSTAPSYKFAKNWSFGTILKFRSQFANGYVSRTEQLQKHRKSNFMTPAYLDLSFGFNYTCPKERFPIKVNLSPLAVSATFVSNSLIRQNGYLYGLEDPDKTAKWEGGSSIQIDFDRSFGKKGIIRYRTTFFSFYGWLSDIGHKNKFSNYTKFVDAYDKWNTSDPKNIKEKPVMSIHPTIRWENTIEIKATKFLSTIFSFQLYYNRAQNFGVQTQTLLSVGVAYTFKNKAKK